MLKKTLTLFITATLTGCVVGPNYQPPQTAVPASFTEAPATRPATQAATRPIDLRTWWTAFNDPMLEKLIERSAAGNFDLRIAEARVREARALRRINASDQYPTVDVGAGYTRARDSEHASQFGSFGPSGADRNRDLWQAGFDSSWELDVFGGVRRNIEASQAQLDASIESQRDVLVSLTAEVARNYVELRGLQKQLRIARQNLLSQRDTADIARARSVAGLQAELEYKQLEAQASTTESLIPTLEAAIRQTIHRLGVLTGQEPNALLAELSPDRDIPAAPPAVPVGLPSELLRRRPDIRQAERELAGATARIGVATADLYPRFALTGNLGLSSDRLGNFIGEPSAFWNFGPSVSWRVFDRGRIKANIEAEDARTAGALARYEQSIIRALEDVENALVGYAKEQQRRAALEQAVAANQRAVELARARYEAKVGDFLPVLEAQRALFATQDALVRSETAVSADVVALFKALGGGW